MNALERLERAKRVLAFLSKKKRRRINERHREVGTRLQDDKDRVSGYDEYDEDDEKADRGRAELARLDGASGAGETRNNSRYQVQPGHGEHLSDMLRSTASRIEELVLEGG